MYARENDDNYGRPLAIEEIKLFIGTSEIHPTLGISPDRNRKNRTLTLNVFFQEGVFCTLKTLEY